MFKSCISVTCVFALVTFVQQSLADFSDGSLPGNSKSVRMVFKKILKNYNPFESPTPNKVFNITTKCRSLGTYVPAENLFNSKFKFTMSWLDKRLAWNSRNIRHGILWTTSNFQRLWLPVWSYLSFGDKTLYIAVAKDGTVTAIKYVTIQVRCRNDYEHKYPYSRKRCVMHLLHPNDYQLVCKGKYGLGCCFNKKEFNMPESMWQLQNISHTYKTVTSFILKPKMDKIIITLVRRSAENHFYVSPALIVGIMSIFQCLVSLTNSRRYLVTCFFIYAAYDCVIAAMSIPIIRSGGGEHLINLCAFTIIFNIVYLIWSCISINVLRAGGTSWSVMKYVVEKTDRYHFFFFLPSHVEVAETSDGPEKATWNYFSLLMDRSIFVIWFVAFASFAKAVL